MAQFLLEIATGQYFAPLGFFCVKTHDVTAINCNSAWCNWMWALSLLVMGTSNKLHLCCVLHTLLYMGTRGYIVVHGEKHVFTFVFEIFVYKCKHPFGLCCICFFSADTKQYFLSALDLKGNKDIVKNFQELIANYSGAVLMAEVSGSSNQSAQFYEVCDFPYNTALIPTSPAKPLAQSIHDSVTETLKSLPKGKSPNWLTGRQRNSRRDAEIIKATNVLVLTLPGTAGIYYGQEIGLVNPDSPVSPMQWTAGSHAGNANM